MSIAARIKIAIVVCAATALIGSVMFAAFMFSHQGMWEVKQKAIFMLVAIWGSGVVMLGAFMVSHEIADAGTPSPTLER